MRNLPRKPTQKQKLIIEAVKDYFEEVNQEVYPTKLFQGIIKQEGIKLDNMAVGTTFS